jgi:hypothetical protein
VPRPLRSLTSLKFNGLPMLNTLILLAVTFLTMHCFALQETHRIQQQKESSIGALKAEPQASASLWVFPLKPTRLNPDEAWSVQITTRGGFTGVGKGELIASSNRLVSWNGLDSSCSRKLGDESRKALSELVLSVDGSSPRDNPNGSFSCADCYVTVFLLQRREPDGTARSYTFVWDESTQAEVPQNVIKMYDELMQFRDCKMQ